MFVDAVPLLLFFIFSSLFCLASIVTVIRLVNDAVDNIESEGMKENPLTPPSLCVHASPGAKEFVQWCNSRLKYSQAATFQTPFHLE